MNYHFCATTVMLLIKYLRRDKKIKLSSLLMGLFRDNETNNLNGTDHGYKSQLARGKSVEYFTSMADDLNSGLP